MEDFLEKFDKENRSKLNLAYLPASVVTAFGSPERSLVAEFVRVYSAKENYKHLRTLHPKDDDSKTWDIIRNKKLNALKEKMAENDTKLFKDDGSPTRDHLELIQWAYSPQPEKVKAYVEKLKSKGDKKRKSSSSSGESSDNVSPAKKKRSA